MFLLFVPYIETVSQQLNHTDAGLLAMKYSNTLTQLS